LGGFRRDGEEERPAKEKGNLEGQKGNWRVLGPQQKLNAKCEKEVHGLKKGCKRLYITEHVGQRKKEGGGGTGLYLLGGEGSRLQMGG